MLSPASKLRTSIKGPRDYLGFTSTNVNHMYKALDVLCANKADIINYLNKQLSKRIADRDTTACLYDITTYAFESTHADSLRDFGYSKDKKFNEVQVVMALATDHHGLPLVLRNIHNFVSRSGYKCLSFSLASCVLKCQFTFLSCLFRSLRYS